MYKGVMYDTADPQFKSMMVADEGLGKAWKRHLIRAVGSLDKKEKKDFMSMVTSALQELCDQLVDVIRLETGKATKPTTDVQGWTKDGNLLLTKFKNSKQDVTVDVCFCTKSSREYINNKLGYEVNTTEYTYPNGYKGLAVVLE